jgi:hypothetical protein
MRMSLTIVAPKVRGFGQRFLIPPNFAYMRRPNTPFPPFGCVCFGVSLDPSEPVPSLPASSCRVSPRSPRGRRPVPAGCTRSSSTGIASLPAKTVSRGACGLAQRATIRRLSRGFGMRWRHCRSRAPCSTARRSCYGRTIHPTSTACARGRDKQRRSWSPTTHHGGRWPGRAS